MMSAFKNLYLTISLFYSFSIACGGDDDLRQCDDTDEYGNTRMLSYAEACDASFSSCNPCPPDGLCITGTVEGMALSNDSVANMIAVIYDSDAAICTIPCNTDSDCAGLDFVTANRYEETLQQWKCKSVRDRSVCAVSIRIENVP